MGRAARFALEDARARISASLGWDGELVLTSGASEALAIALTRCVLPPAAVAAVEHEAVLRHRGDAPLLPVDADGRVAARECARRGLVAVQHVNNETGVIQPLAAIAAEVRGAGGLLLADCAQSAGKLALPDADLIALSAHKFGGPPGIGALLVRDWAMLRPVGGQERGYRPGTENLPGALAMAAAIAAGGEWMEQASRLRGELESGLKSAGAGVVAERAERIATIGSYRMPGVSAASQLIRLDSMGIAVSAGSACSSGSLRPSHVLQAMGLKDENISQVIRISIGPETDKSAIERVVKAWGRLAAGTAGP